MSVAIVAVGQKGSLKTLAQLTNFEQPVELRNSVGTYREFNGPCLTGDATDESPLFKSNQHGVNRGRGEVEELLENGMCGRYPGFIAHHVFAYEGQELPLLASGSAGRLCGAEPLCVLGGFEASQGRAQCLDGGMDGSPDLQGSLLHDGLVLNSDEQPIDRLAQQLRCLGVRSAKAAFTGRRSRIGRIGMAHFHSP